MGVALVLFGYPVLCEAVLRGRSPGKMAFGLRVVTVEGAPEASRHAFIRSTVGIVDFLIPPGGMCAVVSSLLSPRSQRLGDLVAGTMVLRERSASRAPTAVWFSPPAGLEAYARNLDVSGVTDAQFGVIRAFLLRVHDLTPEARVAMAYRLATPIAEAMHHHAPPEVHPEQFLVAVAAAYQRRHSPPPPPATACRHRSHRRRRHHGPRHRLPLRQPRDRRLPRHRPRRRHPPPHARAGRPTPTPEPAGARPPGGRGRDDEDPV